MPHYVLVDDEGFNIVGPYRSRRAAEEALRTALEMARGIRGSFRRGFDPASVHVRQLQPPEELDQELAVAEREGGW